MATDQDTLSTYRPPVAGLLRIGEPDKGNAIVDYDSYGFGRDHVPELVRMVSDDALNNAPPGSDEVWAPLHAWRVLGRLRAGEAIAPLLDLLRRVDDNDDDWVAEDVPDTLAEIGPAILFPVAAYLADAAHGDWARTAAANAIAALGRKHGDVRDQCHAILTRQLERFAEQPEALNSSLVSALVDLKAVEAAPVLEKVFASGRIDEFATGDWEDVQIELGLKDKRETERKPNTWTDLGKRFRETLGVGEDEQDPFFMVIPDTSLGRLLFTQGERAGQVWHVDLACCDDPMCPCWTVEFVCTPEGREGEAPLCFALCAGDRKVVPAPGAGEADIKAREFARDVAASFQAADWERLANYCALEKEDMTECVDVEELAGRFPGALVGAELAGYEEVFPFASSFVFECDGRDWIASDYYCIERKCDCHEVNLTLLPVNAADAEGLKDPADGILLRHSYRTGKDEVISAGRPGFPPTREVVAALLREYPDFRETVEARHADLRFLNEAAMRQQGLLDPVKRETAKVGRNDPCPCGSGKKHKKCCGK